MKQQRFKIFAAALVMLVKDDEILLLKRFNTGFEDGNYSLPSGKINGGETASAGAIREAREETGVKIKITNIAHAHTLYQKSKDEAWAHFFFLAKVWEGKPKNIEPGKCSEIAWFKINHLPPNTIPFIRQAINSWGRGITYSESERPK